MEWRIKFLEYYDDIALPKIVQSSRVPIDFQFFSYLKDHCFEGKAVMPAVEICELLASVVKNKMFKSDVLFIVKAIFNKFLLLDALQKNMELFCDFVVYENNNINVSLITQRKGKRSSISRTIKHASMIFCQNKKLYNTHQFKKTSIKKEEWKKISVKRIYDELIPFGPAYRNIQDTLFLHKKGAFANIYAPFQLVNNMNNFLGSPFVLDAAFHIACVYGQKFYSVVSFPVGFKERIIYKKTKANANYTAMIIPNGQQKEYYIFDILITDDKKELCESVKGLKMQDVSRGRMQPPDWIKKAI